jgi:hypothetical protein
MMVVKDAKVLDLEELLKKLLLKLLKPWWPALPNIFV